MIEQKSYSLFDEPWIAALYVDSKGPYPTIPAVDCWDETRDATRYPGPFAVVSHPPCGGTPTHWVSGGRDVERLGSGGVVPVGIKVCSAQQRRRTPIALAWWLCSLARAATRGVG